MYSLDTDHVIFLLILTCLSSHFRNWFDHLCGDLVLILNIGSSNLGGR